MVYEQQNWVDFVPVAKSSAYAALAGDLVIAAATSGSFTVTLPAGDTGRTAQTVGVKLDSVSAANVVTIVPTGSDRINATDTSLVLSQLGESVILTWDAAGHWHVSSGHKTLTSLDSRYNRVGIRATGMVPVANNTCTYAADTLANLPNVGGCYVHQKFVATTDISAIRIVYGNWFTQVAAPLEQSTGNQMTVRAYVMVNKSGNRVPSNYTYVASSANWSSAGSYVAGNMVRVAGVPYVANQASTNQTPSPTSAYWDQVQYWPVHFAGESATRDVTIQPLQTVFSEPIVISPPIAKGETFYIETYAQPNNGTANTGLMPWGNAFDNTVDWAVTPASGTAPIDYSSAPPASQASVATGSKVYGPIAVIGTPKAGLARTPVVMILGDSISNGTGETSTILTDEVPGWCLRLLTDNPAAPTKYLYCHLRSGKGSTTGAAQLGPGSAIRLMLAAGCTHVIDEYGVNDIGLGSMTLATMQANALARWNTYAALGLKVFASTITPETTSTDSWATTTNQTPGAHFGTGSIWSQYNDWVRTTPAPLTAYLEVANTVLDAGGTVWKAGYTADGIHPTTAAHILIAQNINAVALFGTPP